MIDLDFRWDGEWFFYGGVFVSMVDQLRGPSGLLGDWYERYRCPRAPEAHSAMFLQCFSLILTQKETPVSSSSIAPRQGGNTSLTQKETQGTPTPPDRH